jgi:hypothetical protein
MGIEPWSGGISWLRGDRLVGVFLLVCLLGEVTLAFFLAIVRQGRADIVESPPIVAGHETLDSSPVEAASEVH